MASRNFAESAKNPDFNAKLFYDPTLKQIHSAQCVLDEKSVLLAGYIGKKNLTATYQVDPAARKINKETHVIPVDELADIVKAMTRRDREGSSTKLAIKETDLGGREYYVSLAAGTSTETILTNDNVGEAIRLIKQKESIKGLAQPVESSASSELSQPSGTDGPQ